MWLLLGLLGCFGSEALQGDLDQLCAFAREPVTPSPVMLAETYGKMNTVAPSQVFRDFLEATASSPMDERYEAMVDAAWWKGATLDCPALKRQLAWAAAHAEGRAQTGSWEIAPEE